MQLFPYSLDVCYNMEVMNATFKVLLKNSGERFYMAAMCDVQLQEEIQRRKRVC